jgi:hypothetical protein
VRWPPWRSPARDERHAQRHEDSLREADRRLREITDQRAKVEDLEAILAARRKANRFSAAVREALGGDHQ